MLEIWINGNSIKSCPSLVPKEESPYDWMELRILGSWNNDQLPDDKFKDYK